jgi:hypothetical protein
MSEGVSHARGVRPATAAIGQVAVTVPVRVGATDPRPAIIDAASVNPRPESIFICRFRRLGFAFSRLRRFGGPLTAPLETVNVTDAGAAYVAPSTLTPVELRNRLFNTAAIADFRYQVTVTSRLWLRRLVRSVFGLHLGKTRIAARPETLTPNDSEITQRLGFMAARAGVFHAVSLQHAWNNV